MTAIIAGLNGFGIVFLISLQTRLLADATRTRAIFLTALGINGLWVLGVRSVTTDVLAGCCYVLGASLGAVLASKLRLRKGVEA